MSDAGPAEASPTARPSDGLAGWDAIGLRGLRVTAVVGALETERAAPQPLELDIDVFGDFSQAGQTDRLADALDYAALADTAAAICTTARATLLERLASEIATQLAATDGASGATVTVRKLRPPVPHDLRTAEVRVTRWAT